MRTLLLCMLVAASIRFVWLLRSSGQLDLLLHVEKLCEIVKLRNKLAKSASFEDYYDYKVLNFAEHSPVLVSMAS